MQLYTRAPLLSLDSAVDMILVYVLVYAVVNVTVDAFSRCCPCSMYTRTVQHNCVT